MQASCSGASKRIKAHCGQSPLGCENVAGCYGAKCTYAGINHFSNWPPIWALGSPGLAKTEDALLAWKNNSLAAHAQAFPDMCYAVTAGPDSWYGPWFTPGSGYPGVPKTAPPCKMPAKRACEYGGFPTFYNQFNAWSHSDPLHSAGNAMGLWSTPHGVTLVGGTLNRTAWSLQTPAVSFTRAAGGGSNPAMFAGRYNPATAGA